MYIKLFDHIKKHKYLLMIILFVISFVSVLYFSNSEKYVSASYSNLNTSDTNVSLKDKDKLEQKFSYNIAQLNLMKLNYVGEKDDYVDIEVLSEKGKNVFENRYLLDGSGILELDSLNVYDEIGEVYTISLTFHSDENNTLKIKSIETSEDEFTYSLNGKSKDAKLAMLTEGVNIAHHVKLLIISLLVNVCCAIFIFLSLFKDNRKTHEKFNTIMNSIENKKLLFVLEFVMTMVLILLGLKFFTDLTYRQDINVKILIPLIVSLYITICYFVLLFRRVRNNYSRLFLCLAIPLALCYWILMLPDSIPDESVHFLKTFMLSTFDFTNTNFVNVPKDYVINTIQNYNDIIPKLLTVTNYSSTYLSDQAVTYNSILYIIPSLGLFLTRMLSLSIYLGYYAARLINVFIYLYLGYKAIKITPIAKLCFFVFLLNPMLLHQAISLNADCMLHAVTILFIAYVLHIRFEVNELKNKHLFWLGMFFLFIVLAKYAYLPLFGLVLLFYDKIRNLKKSKLIIFITFCLIVFLIYYLYNYTFSTAKPMAHMEKYMRESNVNVGAQINVLMQSPLVLPKMLYTTFSNLGSFYLMTFAGSRLSWLNLYIDPFITFSYIFILVLSPLTEKLDKFRLKISEKIWMLFLFVLISCIILLGLYVTWTPVGYFMALGVQGRYFIPIGLLLLLGLCNAQKLVLKNEALSFSIGLVIVNILVLNTVISYFS